VYGTLPLILWLGKGLLEAARGSIPHVRIECSEQWISFSFDAQLAEISNFVNDPDNRFNDV
jgi:hypothetical protein